MLSAPANMAFKPLAAQVRQFARSYGMAAASSHAHEKIKYTQLLINGKFVDAQSGKTFATVNPATEEVIANVAEADAADVEIAVQAARQAFETGPWAKTSAAERGRILYKVADLLEQNVDELAAIEALDNGKPFHVARNIDLQLAIKCYRYYAGWADKIQGKTIPMEGPYMCYTRHEPVGVAAQIIPWNFPALMQAWKLGPALAAGCTVVMKPAEQTPLSALYMGHLFHQAGLPAGVLNILPGFGETAGNALAMHTDVDKVAFTGSTEVGHHIMKASGMSNLKRVTLELGGKSPNIIFDDCDIDAAIAQSQLGLFLNQGQCCIAGSRLFVQESIYDQFVEKSVKAAQARKLGAQFDATVDQGPQVSQEQLDKILGLVEMGKKEGATLETGGARWGDRGYFVEPTVFTNVQDNHTIAQEEIFGPVMSILKFKDEDEVIARANNTTYGLGAGLMTSSIERAHRVVNSLKTGTVYVNCYDVFSASAPFGGFKRSGIGRELGEYALDNYIEVKTVITKMDDRTRY